MTATACATAHAHSFAPGDTVHLLKDSLKKTAVIPVAGTAASSADDSVAYQLLHTNHIVKTPAEVRALFHFLKSTRLSNASRDKRVAYRLYFRLAKNFVRMKLYPLAMQCYYQTLLQSGLPAAEAGSNPPPAADDNSGGPSLAAIDPAPADATDVDIEADSLATTALSPDESLGHLAFTDSFFAAALQPSPASTPLDNTGITAVYRDGRKSAAYAIVLHVKQPIPGRRKAYTHFNNVGHFFITLIKYNADTGSVSRTFGFYPQKDNFFAATPLHPGSSAVFKNDALHDWDEAIGKFISRKRFDKLMRLIDRFSAKKYHLNKNNCTDFGLYAATIAGVSIDATSGRWPMGKGNNPANAGQSILEGKILNADTGNKQGLFICNNVKGW